MQLGICQHIDQDLHGRAVCVQPVPPHAVNSWEIYGPTPSKLLCSVPQLLTGLNSKRWVVQHETKGQSCPDQ